jgi:kynureninase
MALVIPMEPSLPALDGAACARLDADPAFAPLGALRERFAPGAPGTLYFDANSIGPMPADAPRRMQATMDGGWRVDRRRSWNERDWLAQPRTLGAAIAPVLGAAPEDVLVCDGTSVNQYKLLRHALAVAAPRRVIVAEREVFPSNRHVAEGVAHAGLAALRLVDDAGDPAQVAAALAPGDVAVVALSHVDYRSSRRLDMAALTATAHAYGALALWDLSHSAGAVAIGLRDCDADLAVGCGYKYLCGGPGAPGFLYVHPRLREGAWPAICGWMGHADTFGFEGDFRPAADVGRFQAATPSVLANAAFSAAAELWAQVPPALLDARQRSLTDTLIALLDVRCAGFGIALASPRDHARRGGHVALRFEGAGVLAQALVEAGVVVSARKPDALRFGVHPLTTTHVELWEATGRLHGLLERGTWREARFQGASA